MVLTDKWFSTLAQTENDEYIFISGRDELDEFRKCGKISIRIELNWKYKPSHNQMPTEEESVLMEEVQTALKKVMEKDKLAIMTAIYTGAGVRTWVFYARTERVFGERLNEALANYPMLPIEIYCEKDPQWEEYCDMYEQIKPIAE